MNEIAAKLGEVGLPAPVTELAGTHWDAVDRRRRPQRPDRRRVPGPRRASRCSSSSDGSGSAARARSSGRSATTATRSARARTWSGCSTSSSSTSCDLRRRGFECYVADPNLWVPFADGTSFAQWLDDATTQRNLDDLKVSKRDIEGYWAYEHIFDEIRKRLRTGDARQLGGGDARRATRSRTLLDHDQTMIDIVFNASIADVLDDYISDQRIKDALFGQGIIAAYGGPKDAGTASIKLMHYQGDLEGQGPVWGYVKGGMGMISFAIADAAQEAGAQLATASPWPRSVPERGRAARGRHAHPRPHRHLQRRPQARARASSREIPDDYRARLEAWKIRSPVVKFNAALNALPAVDRRARRGLAGQGDDRPHRRPRGRPARVRGLRAGRRRHRLRRDLHPDRLRPLARRRRAATC